MTKSIAIVQSNYVPWRGYFDLIRSVDEFVLLDDVQFTRRDWRNRNRIKTAKGPAWLTIPVRSKGRYHQLINETEVVGPDWAINHWQKIEAAYKSAPYFDVYRGGLLSLFEQAQRESNLTNINFILLSEICKLLGITTPFSWSSDYGHVGSKTERLLRICVQANADCYLSGPAARAYIDPQRFIENGIELVYADYEGYPKYPQLYGEFCPNMSIIDLIFCAGPNALEYMKPTLMGNLDRAYEDRTAKKRTGGSG